MKRYYINMDLLSDIEAERWEAYLVKAIEKTGASVNFVSVRERSPGRPPTNGPKIEAFMRGLSKAAQQNISVEQIMQGTSIGELQIKRYMRSQVMAGRVQRVRLADREFGYRLLDDGVAEE